VIHAQLHPPAGPAAKPVPHRAGAQRQHGETNTTNWWHSPSGCAMALALVGSAARPRTALEPWHWSNPATASPCCQRPRHQSACPVSRKKAARRRRHS